MGAENKRQSSWHIYKFASCLNSDIAYINDTKFNLPTAHHKKY